MIRRPATRPKGPLARLARSFARVGQSVFEKRRLASSRCSVGWACASDLPRIPDSETGMFAFSPNPSVSGPKASNLAGSCNHRI